MATELYGVDAQLVKSIGVTPVSTETNIIFLGSSPEGDLNKPVLITSLADYDSKLGGEPGDGYNLTEAAIAAFSVANIDKCWMIPVSHSQEVVANDYIGSADDESGVFAIEKLLRNNPTAVNLICAPSVYDSTILSAINTICQKAAGHWQSFMVYDVEQDVDQINSAGVAIVSEILLAKQLNSERARAVWANVLTSGGYSISGAAVQACLMAVSDSNYGVPARCGGNLNIPNIQNICIKIDSDPAIVVLKESDATQLSADGICSWINYGGGIWHTWGDHTSAFSEGSISEERGRFDNYMRMQMMIANRFQLKYRFTIDDPMTLQMRNDVITEEEDYLNGLVAIGALVGQPKVEFVAAENSIDRIAQGYFTWSTSTTEAPPRKYMLAKVAYTQAGLDVFTQEG